MSSSWNDTCSLCKSKVDGEVMGSKPTCAWYCLKKVYIYIYISKLREWKKAEEDQKITLVEVIKKYMSITGVKESMTLDRVEWRKRIHMANPN